MKRSVHTMPNALAGGANEGKLRLKYTSFAFIENNEPIIPAPRAIARLISNLLTFNLPFTLKIFSMMQPPTV
jgi:hypothetical protein